MTLKKYTCALCTIVLLFFASPVRSQNLPWADYKTIQWGFTLGLNVMDFGITPSMLPINGKIYEADVASLVPGFSVGVIGGVRLGEYFSLRLVPMLHLSDRTLTYVNSTDNEVLRQNIKTTLITAPIYIKYSAVRINNYRPYLIAGGGLSFDLARDRQRPVLLNTYDYFVDFGFGCTFYFGFFRFSPELKFALGFNNILTPLPDRPSDIVLPEDRKYTEALSRLTSRMFTLTFNFE